jgi:NAD(P)-dependent dehydrogenase (short-subunit alcohol dehydrogenase family)
MQIMGQLDGKRVVLTGAAKGIGAGTARRCAAEGAALLLVDVDENVREVAAELEAEFVISDITGRDAPDEIVDAAKKCLGGIDGLGNIAGVQGQGDILEISDELWDKAMAVNLVAPLRLSRAAMPTLMEDGGGAIVNMCSVAAIAVRPALTGYNVSKHALLGLTRSMAVDFGRRGVRTNGISPGTIVTEFTERFLDERPGERERLLEASGVGRLGTPDDVAPMVVYLMGDDSTFINGANFVVDAARSILT